jgi:RNA-directed DNA polymerase
MRESKLQGKSFDIPKRLVWEAWLRVQENGGAAGPDGVSIAQFAGCAQDNLYKLWNRMSSGSYFPGPVRAVEIPKGNGGVRVLGIPNVIDRVAQTAMALWLEPGLEKVFHPDSYGYRPGRSPHDALRVCRERCWRDDWVIDLDIKAFFDSVSWDLMLRAVAQQTDQKWILLYLERCLKAPMQKADGTVVERTRGTPQGGPISPLIANLFLHWAFDDWLVRTYPGVRFERFADDAIIHCGSEDQARGILAALTARLADVGLVLHPDKTRIVYCKDSNRPGTHEHISFTFLGYTFRPRKAWNKTRKVAFTSFLPAACPEKVTKFSRSIHDQRLHRRTNLTLDDLAAEINPQVRGWLGYFTAFYPTEVVPVGKRIDHHLMRWARRKYKRLKRRKPRARAWLRRVRARQPDLFAHWQLRYKL